MNRAAGVLVVLAASALLIAFASANPPTPAITEYSSGLTAGGAPDGIAPGPDGAMWVTEFNADKIARVAPDGTITEYPPAGSTQLTAGAKPSQIVTGPDGNLWFTEFGVGKIGELDPNTGTLIAEYSLPSGSATQPEGITVGPDNALWFTEYGAGQIGRLDPSNPASITEYLFSDTNYRPIDLVSANGKLWVSLNFQNAVAEVDPSTVTPDGLHGITLFGLATGSAGAEGLALDANGKLWVAEYTVGKVAELDPANPQNSPPEYTTGSGSHPLWAASASDGGLWLTDNQAHTLIRFDTTSLTPTTFGSAQGVNGDATADAEDAAGNLWFTEFNAGQVGLVGLVPVNTSPPVITGTPSPGQVLSCSNGAWTPQPTTYQFQWLLDGVAINNATTSQYSVQSGDLGHSLSCNVLASTALGITGSGTSSGVTVINNLPVNTAAPAITGTVQVGQTVSCSSGTWTNGPNTFGYRWFLNGTPVAGQTAQTYTIPAGASGRQLRCEVTATNANGSASQFSAAVLVAAGPKPPTPTLVTRIVRGRVILNASGSTGNGSKIAGYRFRINGFPTITCGPDSPVAEPTFSRQVRGSVALTVLNSAGSSATITVPFTAPGVAAVTKGGHLRAGHTTSGKLLGRPQLIAYQCLPAPGTHPGDNVPLSGGVPISSACELDAGIVQIEGCGLQPVSDLCNGVPSAELQIVEAHMVQQAAGAIAHTTLGPCGDSLTARVLASAARGLITRVPPYQQIADAFYVSTDPVRVNGIDLFPKKGGAIVVVMGGRLLSQFKRLSVYLVSSNVSTELGGFPMPVDHRLDLDVTNASVLHADQPCATGNNELTGQPLKNGPTVMELPLGMFSLQNPVSLPKWLRVINSQNPGTPLASIPQLPITGALTIGLGAAGNAYITVNVSLNRVLDDPADPDGNNTGCMVLRANNKLGVDVGHFDINAPQISLPDSASLAVKLTYDRPTDFFGGTLFVETKDLGLGGQIGGGIEFQNGVFKDASAGYVADPGGGFPLGGGFFLVKVDAKFYLFESAIPGSHTEIDGDLGISYGPALDNNGCGLINILGQARLVFYPGPFSVDSVGSVGFYCYPLVSRYFHIDADGHVVMGITAGFDLGFLSVNANFDGQAYVDFKSVPRVQLDGSTTATLNLPDPIGKQSDNVNAVLSDRGAGICGQVSVPFHTFSVGVGETFIPPPINQLVFINNLSLMYDGCDLSKYQSLTPGGPPNLAHDARASARDIILVPPGKQTTVIALRGQGAPPSVTLRGPGGESIDTANDMLSSKALVIRQSTTNVTLVELGNVRAGRWIVTRDAGSPQIMLARTAHVMPRPQIRARVTGHGSSRVLRYSIVPRPGMKVTFLERGKNGSTVIGVARHRHGKIAFTPSEARPGVRLIVASIAQNGLPSPSIVVAHYRASPPRPGRVSRLRATYRRGGLTVSFRAAPLAETHLIALSLSDGRGLRLLVPRGRHSLFVARVPKTVRILHLAVYGIRDGSRGPRVTLSKKRRARRGRH